MEKKRMIFELDNTLLTGDFKTTEEYFKSVYGYEKEILLDTLGENLRRYEKIFKRYTIEDLSTFLTMKTNLQVTESILEGWLEALSEGKEEKEEDIRKTLEELKRQGKSLVVLTNWFRTCQKRRLEKEGLLEYFDEIYGGEEVIKPDKASYIAARDTYTPNETVVIGPNLTNDYIIPRANCLESVLYDKEEGHHRTIVKVKRLNELVRKY